MMGHSTDIVATTAWQGSARMPCRAQIALILSRRPYTSHQSAVLCSAANPTTLPVACTCPAVHLQVADSRFEELQAGYTSKEEELVDTAKALRRVTAKLEAAQASLETSRRDIQQVCGGGGEGWASRRMALACAASCPPACQHCNTVPPRLGPKPHPAA